MFYYEVQENIMDKAKSDKEVLAALMRHSFESFVYSIRAAEFNFAIASEMGFNIDEAEKQFIAGMYHDVGKIGMPRGLIDYPGRYTTDMRQQMMQHTQGGKELLDKVNAPSFISETAAYHHCNYDGSGYLNALKGEDIPFHARLTRVSDSADAYLSTRSYKPGHPVAGLFDDLNQFSGTWYDPEIINYMRKVHGRIIRKAASGEGLSQDEYMAQMKKEYQIAPVAENHLFDVIHN